MQLREEEWGHDDDDEQGGSLFHRRLFFCSCSFSLAKVTGRSAGRKQPRVTTHLTHAWTPFSASTADGWETPLTARLTTAATHLCMIYGLRSEDAISGHKMCGFVTFPFERITDDFNSQENIVPDMKT